MKLDEEDKLSYVQRQFFKEKESTPITPVTIFLAVFFGILGVWLFEKAYQEWQSRQALEIFNQQMNAIEMQSQQQRKQYRLAAVKAQSELQNKLELQAKEQAEMKALAEQQAREQKLSEIAASLQGARKENAWLSYYKPAAGCELSNVNRDLVNCANDHARARKSFEEAWLHNSANMNSIYNKVCSKNGVITNCQ